MSTLVPNCYWLWGTELDHGGTARIHFVYILAAWVVSSVKKAGQYLKWKRQILVNDNYHSREEGPAWIELNLDLCTRTGHFKRRLKELLGVGRTVEALVEPGEGGSRKCHWSRWISSGFVNQFLLTSSSTEAGTHRCPIYRCRLK